MTFKVVLEPGEDGWIVAECPSLPGCVSQGRTDTEAVGFAHGCSSPVRCERARVYGNRRACREQVVTKEARM